MDSLGYNCGNRVDLVVDLLYQIENCHINISWWLREYQSTIYHQCEYVYDSIVVIVLYDVPLEEITLRTFILPFQSGHGNKNACVYTRHLCQLFPEQDLLWLLPKKLIWIWRRYSEQSRIFLHCWSQVLMIEGETSIRRVLKQNGSLK